MMEANTSYNERTMMAKIRITDLRLRAIIGIYDWERENKQDIIINVTLEYDAEKPARSDKIEDTIDYKAITKEIIKMTERSEFYLLEKLAGEILMITLKNPLVLKSTVKVDKPAALRFADSVSVELTKENNQ